MKVHPEDHQRDGRLVHLLNRLPRDHVTCLPGVAVERQAVFGFAPAAFEAEAEDDQEIEETEDEHRGADDARPRDDAVMMLNPAVVNQKADAGEWTEGDGNCDQSPHRPGILADDSVHH